MQIASSLGLPSTAILAVLPVIAGARLGLKLLRRNGRRVSGAEAGPEIERAIGQLLAGKVGFVVFSSSRRDYIQFARQPGDIIVAEANAAPDDASIGTFVLQAGLTPTGGLPAFHGEMRSPSAGLLGNLAIGYFQRLGTAPINVRVGR